METLVEYSNLAKMQTSIKVFKNIQNISDYKTSSHLGHSDKRKLIPKNINTQKSKMSLGFKSL